VTALLEVDSLEVMYGQARALFGVTFSIENGTVLAVLGPNGAGKSTLARAVTGLVPVASGTVRFDGENITGRSANYIRQRGLSQAPEGRGVFPSLTVMENLRMATHAFGSRVQRKEAMDRAVTTYPSLAGRMRQSAGTLSGGEQQMLSLAIALAMNVRLVVIDELSLGLAPLIVDEVFESVRRIKEVGTTILIIEQFVDRALSLADRCLVLHRGEVTWRGSSREARADIDSLYLGEELDSVMHSASSDNGSSTLP